MSVGDRYTGVRQGVTFFQVLCVILAVFELPTIYLLLAKGFPLPTATPWFDDKVYYQRNLSLSYTYAMMLVALVVVRLMVAAKPRLRVLTYHAALLHSLEVPFFFYLMRVKEVPAEAECYILMSITTFNAGVFIFRGYQLTMAAEKQERNEQEWREKQLAIIRKKRADYRKAQAQAAQHR